MGMGFGLQSADLVMKRKFRWLFSIPGVSLTGTDALPHKRGARPGVNLKEQDCQHLSETIYFPLKPEWKQVNLTLYDIRCNANPVFDWLTSIYTLNGDASTFNPCQLKGSEYKKPQANLELLDGCGNVLEMWLFENIYASSIDWGELDMDSADFVTVELTLRYDRAYLV